MRASDGAWVGWSGAPGPAPEPFDADGMRLLPVGLSEDEVASYYEGFSNATLWPLYHDVIARPVFHRQWWGAYQQVNGRFAEAAAAQAAKGATVWVHDYQLQLVPALLRAARPDLRIGFFNHIPFPGFEIFAQLPWRRADRRRTARRGPGRVPAPAGRAPTSCGPAGELPAAPRVAPR